MVEHIMACLCGVETPCTFEDQKVGVVWQCPSCKVVTARVTPRRGGDRIWIKVDPSEVAFYRLLEEPMEDEE